MDEKAIENLINGFGAMTELWIIAFKCFIEHGMTEQQAIAHTKAFTSSIVEQLMKK